MNKYTDRLIDMMNTAARSIKGTVSRKLKHRLLYIIQKFDFIACVQSLKGELLNDL